MNIRNITETFQLASRSVKKNDLFVIFEQRNGVSHEDADLENAFRSIYTIFDESI